MISSTFFCFLAGALFLLTSLTHFTVGEGSNYPPGTKYVHGCGDCFGSCPSIKGKKPIVNFDPPTRSGNKWAFKSKNDVDVAIFKGTNTNPNDASRVVLDVNENQALGCYVVGVRDSKTPEQFALIDTGVLGGNSRCTKVFKLPFDSAFSVRVWQIGDITCPN